jgi:hypothetical protein
VRLDRSVLEKLQGGRYGYFLARAAIRANVSAGSIGLLFNASALFGPTGSIGVGTPVYLTATSMIWIGGMVLFGMGALLSRNDFAGRTPYPTGRRRCQSHTMIDESRLVELGLRAKTKG